MLAFPELETKGRAIMAGITFRSFMEINAPFLQSLLAAATNRQAEAHLTHKPFIQKKQNPGKTKRKT
jgi:hypothetical protein